MCLAFEVISQGEPKPLWAYRAQGQIWINMIKYGWMLIKHRPSVALTKRIMWKGKTLLQGCRAKHENIHSAHLGLIYYTITKERERKCSGLIVAAVKHDSLLEWFIVGIPPLKPGWGSIRCNQADRVRYDWSSLGPITLIKQHRNESLYVSTPAP